MQFILNLSTKKRVLETEPLAMSSCFHPSQPDQVAEALASLDVASPVVVEVVRLTWAGGLLSEADKALLGSAVEWAGPWIMAAKKDELVFVIVVVFCRYAWNP